ncbi:hypothetical protein KL911_003598 [Ogataea haglerorum]|uniref:uncharacterized protein n=1 Tax=Ogataea haglerorum TaxID=1937702 RepID=UPI001C8AC8AA|nr:uncharacterized protein KL911_003598 [Ogataea haglerorum]KAG7752867.1 hypothetical protein KL911_003598 [Ogataea haglerorum]
MSETERDNYTSIDLAMSQNTQNLGDVGTVIENLAVQNSVPAEGPEADLASNEIDKQDHHEGLSSPAGIETAMLPGSEPSRTEDDIDLPEDSSDQLPSAKSAETAPHEKAISDNYQTQESAVLGPEEGVLSEEVPADSSEPLQDTPEVSLEPDLHPQDPLLVDSIPSNDVVQHREQPDVSTSPLVVDDTQLEGKDETEHLIETLSVANADETSLAAQPSETENHPNTKTVPLPVETHQEMDAVQDTPEEPEQVATADASASNIADIVEDPSQEQLLGEANKREPLDSFDLAKTAPIERSQPEEPTLPWDEEPVESLPWETDGPSKPLSEEQPLQQPEETAPEQSLADSPEHSPEQSPEQPQDEVLPWDTEPREPLPWEATSGDGYENGANATQDFLESIGVENSTEAPKNIPSEEIPNVVKDGQAEKSLEASEQDLTATVKPEEPREEQKKEPKLDDKLSFLEGDNELLLDEVLDDDFLDDEPSTAPATTPVPQAPAPAFASRYAPQGLQATSPPPPPVLTSSYTNFQGPSLQQSHIKEKLEKEKKKTDAYDFPAELLAKHTPISKTPAPKQNVYTMIELQKSHANNPASPASQSNPLPPRTGSISSTRSTPPPGRATLKPQKSFFEELPLPSIGSASLPAKNPYEINPSSSTVRNPYQPKSPGISRTSPYSPVVANAQLAGINQPAAGGPHPLPPIGGRPRKSTNPYAPAEAGGHARTSSTTSNPPVNPNVVPVPHKSPIAKMASPRIPTTHPQFPQPANDVNNFGVPQPQLGASQPQARHPSNLQKATKYSPYTPQAQQSKLVPFPHPLGQPKSNYQPLDSVYGDNLKPDTSSPSVSHKRRSSFLPPGKNSGYSSTRSNASTHLVQSTPAPVVVNPENLVRRQWPLFSFSGSNKVAYLVPSSYGYGHHKHNVKIVDGNYVFKNEVLVQQFPGPLVKNKTKKKDVEKWINDKLLSLGADLEGPFTSEVHLLWAVMRALVTNINKPGDFAQKEYLRSVVQVLNPSLAVNSQEGPTELSTIENYYVPNQKPFNAHKLEKVGLLNLSKYLEAGDKLGALQMAIVEEDWAIALIVANMLGQEAFAKVTKLYTERNFDGADVLQQNLSFCLQSSGENEFSAEQLHGKEEWVIDNFRSVIPFVLLNNKNPASVLVQVGSLLSEAGFELHGKICFLLSGLPLIPKIQTFSPSSIDSMIIDELYEYILSSSSNIPPAFSNGFPHILSVKVHHASYLLDVGHFAEAKKYVDHTTGIIKSKATYVDPAVAFANGQLLERLSQTEIEVSGWFGGKLGRSGLDKVWGHLDKSFNKFVAGEELEDGKKAKSEGVFAKYSPAPSRTHSQMDLSNIQPQSQPVMPTYQTLSRAPSFGMYSSSSHSQSAPTTSSTSTLIQSHQSSYSQAKTKSKKASTYAPLSPQNAGIVYDNEKPVLNTAPPSSPGSSPSAQTAGQSPSAPRYPPAAARSNSFAEVGRSRPDLPFTTSTPGPGQTYAPQTPLQLDNREACGKVSKYGPRKELADYGAYTPAPIDKEEKPDLGEEYDTSIMTDDIVQQPAARKFVPNRVESLVISPVQSNEPSSPPQATAPPPEPQAENESPKPSTAEPKKPKIYNPYAHVTSRKVNGSNQSRYKPPTNVTAESTQSPDDTKDQDFQAPEFDSYDFYSYGGYHAPTAAEIEAAKKAEVEEKERQENEASLPVENEPKDHHSPELESDLDSEPSDEPLPPPSGRILRPAASFHAADASHLQSMFDPPSAPYRQARSPATVITDQKRYHAEDDDQEYYDDVVDDDDDDEETKEQKKKQDEEEKKKKKEQEAKQKEEEQKHADKGGSSWFSWLGKKKNDQPKPIRAKLGEESSFYYDEKLKRWVNKNASPEEQAASTPPPPPPVKRAVSDSASGQPLSDKPNAMGAPPRGPPAGPPTPATLNGTKKTDNIEDLLSMSVSTTRKSKRGPRRGYVDVMGNK